MIARLRVSGFLAAALWLTVASCLGLAQTAPPADTDQALRARVTEFLQGFIDRKFIPLLPLVAQDTQEEFIAMGKTEMKSFKIDKIEYSDNFTKAMVKLNVVKIWRWEGNELLPQVPLDLTWKIENGKWVWYHELKNEEMVTPMGPSDLSKIMQQAQGGTLPQVPKLSESALQATAQSLMRQASLDKSEVTLARDKASSVEIGVKNGAPGKVSLSLVGLPSFDGFKVTLEDPNPEGGATAKIRVEFDPSVNPNSPPPSSTMFSILVTPFNQQMVVHVKFEPTAK